MEIIYSTSRFSWSHEVTPGFKTSQPTEADLEPMLDGEGNEVVGEDGKPLLALKRGWEPQVEQVELDTIVVAEADEKDATVFKIAFDKDGLARFISYYVEHLDANGRNALRQALSETSDIIIPEPNVTKGGLKLVES